MKGCIVLFALALPVLECRSDSPHSDLSELDEMGLLPQYRIEYELNVEGNAADVKVNESVELVVCETFSEGCHVSDLPSPLPRLRHHEDRVNLIPYLHPGVNRLKVSRRPYGEDDPLSFSVVRIDTAGRETLFEHRLDPGAAEVSFQVDIPGDCSPPSFPASDWVVRFLDPFPEAFRTWDDEAYSQMLIPARTDEHAVNRSQQLVALRQHPLLGKAPSSGALHQDHRSAELAMNYSCETDRLFVYPVDGGYLVAFVEANGQLLLANSVELAHVDGQWYLAGF